MATSKLYLRAAAVYGGASVGAAAYGAHATQDMDEVLKITYANGNKLHMIHSAALMAGAGSVSALRFPKTTLALFAGGITVFSGSCYAAALTGDRANGKLAPLGGTTLILAWLSLALLPILNTVLLPS